MSLKVIEYTAKQFSDARRDLSEQLQALNDEIARAKRKALPGIRKAVDIAAALHRTLRDIIGENAGSFEKPPQRVAVKEFFIGPAAQERCGAGISNSAGRENALQVDDRVRLNVHHVGEAANFLLRKRVARRLVEVHVADVHFLGVLEIAFQVEFRHGVLVPSSNLRAMPINTEFPRDWMKRLREGK